MRIAAKVRLEKERHPERFCTDNRCLWRTSTRAGTRPCPKHMRDVPPMIQWVRVLEQGGAKLTDAGHAALGRNPENLRQECAWCSALIRDGALTPEGYSSHGICPTCSKREFPDPRMRDEDGFLTEHDPEPRFPRRPPEEDA